MDKPSPLILVGHIAGAFGVHGEVRLYAYTAEPDGVAAYGPLLNERGEIVLTPKRARPLKEGVVVSAPEVRTREQAEALKGVKLYVPRDRLPQPEEDDEYYAVDLIGCAVETAAGDSLGRITAIHDFGAGDILEIQDGAKTWRLPFTAENTPKIDLKARLVIADPPPELLDPGRKD